MPPSPQLKKGKDPVSETLCFLVTYNNNNNNNYNNNNNNNYNNNNNNTADVVTLFVP
jgi:hypothetical protein